MKNHSIMTNEISMNSGRREVAVEDNAKALTDCLSRQQHFAKLLEEKQKEEEKKKVYQKRKQQKKREADLREKLSKLQKQKRYKEEELEGYYLFFIFKLTVKF